MHNTNGNPGRFFIFDRMMRRLFFLLILAIPSLMLAQDPANGIYQITGMVVSETSDEPIPFARIQVNHTRRGAIANETGFYSIPVGLRDTLYFSHVGYHDSKLVVAEYLRNYQGDRSQYVYVVNYMREDTFELEEIVIFPYDTPEELRTALVNLGNTETALERAARQNLAPDQLHEIMEYLPVDGNERLMVARQAYYQRYQNQNLVQTAGIDPVAAARLLQYIVSRAKQRKTKDLNYWQD